MTVPEGMEKVKATQSLPVQANVTAEGSVLTEPAKVALGGDYPGVGVNIPAGTVLRLPDGFVGDLEISASVIEPSAKMTAAAASAGIEMPAGVVYFGPSGLEFDPPYTMSLKLDQKVLESLQSSTNRAAVVRWNNEDSAWEELQGGSMEIVDDMVLVTNSRFSAYGAVSVPVQLTIKPSPVQAPTSSPAGGSSSPAGPVNIPDTSEEAPRSTPMIIALSVLGSVIVLAIVAFGCWMLKRPKRPQGLSSYLMPPGMGAELPPVGGISDISQSGYTRGPDQSAIDAKIAEVPRQHDLVSISAPMSVAQQTQPSIQQVGGLVTPMTSTSMSLPGMRSDEHFGVVGETSRADSVTTSAIGMPGIPAQQETDIKQTQESMLPIRMGTQVTTALVDPESIPAGSIMLKSSQAVPHKASGSLAAAGSASPLSSFVASSKRTGLDTDAQSQRSARSSRVSVSRQSESKRSDSPLGDLDYDSTDNESLNGSESSDGDSEGPALTQADLTSLLAGVAAAERLGTMYIEPNSTNMFAGFDQYSTGVSTEAATPSHVPPSGSESPRSRRSGRSRSSRATARSDQGVPVSAAAAIQVITYAHTSYQLAFMNTR